MRKKHRHRKKANAEVNLGFQIAPMIDVVFVILLFFIVSASSVRRNSGRERHGSCAGCWTDRRSLWRPVAGPFSIRAPAPS
jgi:hypothetical protein